MLKKRRSQIEFVALMASLMSIAALALDALLPALDIIGFAVGTTNPADQQLLIVLFFLGLGAGPLLFGPVSDSIGRKPMVYVGFMLFIGASMLCIFAPNLELMIAGRILQGVALSAPRTISIAMIRDSYSGDYMARIMSFVTVVFILVPIIAPASGKFILDRYNWQAIFYVQVFFSILVSLWFWRRQPETLKEENRIGFSARIFTSGFRTLLRYKTTIAFTVISGFITGSFLVYLSTSQQIFQVQYNLKDEFPYIFAGLALTIGSAIFLNGTLVLRLGMRRLISASLLAFFAISLAYILLFYNSGNPSVGVLLLFFGFQFFAIGFLFGNLRAIAMEPVGHIAGMAAAITGFVSTLMAVPISTFIGRFVTDTALPIFIGFLVCSSISLAILGYLSRLHQKEVPQTSNF